MKTVSETVRMISEFNKYRGINVSPTGTLISIFFLIAFAAVGVFFAVLRITENEIFGALSGSVTAFFLWIITFSSVRERIGKQLPEMKKQYIQRKRIEHLSQLPPELFRKMSLETVMKRKADIKVQSDVIFLFDGKNTFPMESLEAVPENGLTVICIDASAEKIKEHFSGKLSFIVTVGEIAADHPELDYPDEKQKKRLKPADILRHADPWKLLRLSLMFIIFGFFGGRYYYFASAFSFVFALAVWGVKIKAR